MKNISIEYISASERNWEEQFYSRVDVSNKK